MTRKRHADPDTWRQNVRKKKREAGEEYVDIKGKVHKKRVVGAGCRKGNKCRFKCNVQISNAERQSIHSKFWELNDEGKSHFFNNFTTRVVKLGKEQ